MLLAGLSSFAEGALAQAFESRAPRAFLYDVNSRTVLYTQLADEAFEPASMAKTLTAAVVFAAIANGTVSLDTPFTISEDAWRRGGGPSGRAAMFAELGSDVAIADLLRGLTIIAGNDAAIALSEGVAGSERAFAARMTDLATELGASNSRFTNATGQPERRDAHDGARHGGDHDGPDRRPR
jgi:D-alanyl-D-alanine carboxypeptidase (penicillin-binding protein 5/6)